MTEVVDGLVVRSRSGERRYRRHRRLHASTVCLFCDLVEQGTDQIIERTKHCLIMKNFFGYELWDGCGVEEHLMIIPKRHVTSLAELSKEELSDYMDQIVHFEVQNYSIYARAPGNKTRSVAHQHTHLIKIDNKPRKFLFYLRKPHVLWTR